MFMIDTAKLISLIKDKPAIWDQTIEEYKDKALKALCWREVTAALTDNFDKMVEKEQQEIIKMVIRKWTHTRDSWMKYVKAKHNCGKPSSRTKYSRPYIYYKQMMFLKKIITISLERRKNYVKNEIMSESDDNMEAETNDRDNYEDSPDEAPSDESPTSKTKTTPAVKKQKTQSEDVEVSPNYFGHEIYVTNRDDFEDRHLSFFKSLLPSLTMLDDDQTLEFQSGVLRLLKDVKRQRVL